MEASSDFVPQYYPIQVPEFPASSAKTMLSVRRNGQRIARPDARQRFVERPVLVSLIATHYAPRRSISRPTRS